MNIGDRVRLVHASEEGIITKLLDKNLIEVEIEDGFRIPVRRAEVAVVSVEEQIRFGSKTNTAKNNDAPIPAAVLAQKGIYTAYTMLNDKNGALYLINNTDFDLPFVIGRETNGQYQALRAGVLLQRNVQKADEMLLSDFENWGTFIFQFLFFRHGHDTPREPMTHKIRYRANTFLTNKVATPILNKEGYLMQLDGNALPLAQTAKQESVQPETNKIDVQKLKEAMFESTQKTPIIQTQTLKKPAHEVDLHIETLTFDHAQMNNGQMLELQLETFEKALENAIATGMMDIVFIHGVGTGKLRTEIHKRLSGHTNIRFFADAHKEKFGYGATEVSFK